MSISIYSNSSSLRAQSALVRSTQSMQGIGERLSSGQRINRSVDDPAGVSIALQLSVHQRVYTQGIRNLNYGLSVLSVADGATQELTQILTRLQELAEQGANGVYGDAQRKALNGEAQSLMQEYNRIRDATKFNNSNVFELLAAGLNLQGGFGNNQIVTINGEDAGNGAGVVITSTIAASTNSSNVLSSGSDSEEPSFSLDGRYVVFSSYSTTLISGDSNTNKDIFIKDLVTGTTQRVSTSSSGAQGTGGDSFDPEISSDGKYVVFASYSNTLVSGDTNGSSDIFVKNLSTGEITSITSGANNNSQNPHFSSDGRYVVFESDATNLVGSDSNGRTDIFMKDLLTGTLTRVSTSSAGGESNGNSTKAQISADGRYVLFQSYGSNLVSGDTNGAADIFVKDITTGTVSRVNTTSNGSQSSGGDSYNATFSANGQSVVFSSYANNLVSGDVNGAADIFLKNLLNESISQVSTSSSGNEGNADSDQASISRDGRYIAFMSYATNLTSTPNGGASDIYVKDIVTGSTTQISASNTTSDAYAPSFSPDGRYVVYASYANNAAVGDSNGAADVFVTSLDQFGLGPKPSAIRYLQGIDISTQSAARSSLTTAQTYAEEISQVRSSIGVGMYRCSTALGALYATNESYGQAESRIRDTDMAEEMTKFVALKLRQQIGAAILAKANIDPQIALQLLT